MPRKIRPIRVEGNLAFVPLTLGYFAVIDAGDAEGISKWNWHARVDGNRVYAARNVPADQNGKRGAMKMHRQIANPPTGMEVDHIDGDGLNNRLGNLRIATKSQNQCNRRPMATSTTGLKGVSPYNRDGTWRARISVRGRRISLGYYKTPAEAHAAYVAASIKLHGPFGRTS